MQTYKKLNDTTVEVTTPIVSIMTIDVLLNTKDTLLKKIEELTQQVADIDQQVLDFKGLAIMTKEEYEIANPVVVEVPVEEPIIP